MSDEEVVVLDGDLFSDEPLTENEDVVAKEITFEVFVDDYFTNYSDSLKTFIKNELNNVLVNFHDYKDENEFDWRFQKTVREAVIKYSKTVVEDVKRNSKKKELKEIIEFLNNEDAVLENVIWHDIYKYLVGLQSTFSFLTIFRREVNE